MNMENKSYSSKNTLNGINIDLFSKDELNAIHYATENLLSEYGIKVINENAREIFKNAGCEIDEKEQMVKIPPHLLESAIRTTPSRFKLYGRDKKKSIVQESGEEICWTNFGIGVKVNTYDESTGKYITRDSTEEDIGQIAKLVDWADNIDLCFHPVEAMDMIGEGSSLIHGQYQLMTNSSKPIHLDTTADHIDYNIEMQAAYYGGDIEEVIKKPICTVGGCPSSPLELNDNCCRALIKCAEYGYPKLQLSMAMGGASSPIFMAGTLVTHNAEVLSGIVLSQLVNPGSPIWYGSSTTAFDLRRGTAPVGCPELGLISAGVAKLAQFYRLPSLVAGA
jgi:trimethylamine--corrinoid protein Co-methyltransferase